MDPASLLPDLKPLAVEAGKHTLTYFKTGADIEHKDDNSPVTIADQEAEDIILAGLAKLAPDIPVVAEEAMAAGHNPDISGGTFFLVDALDGTKEFINGRDEFTTNIALIVDLQPVLGVIYVPAKRDLYAGCGPGTATLNDAPIQVRDIPDEGLTVVSSRSHSDEEKLAAFLDGKNIAGHCVYGSSLKLCAIAAGKADLYPRFKPTCEWDIGAGDAILRAAGGEVVTLDGTPLPYGKKDAGYLNPHFIAKT